MNAYRIALEQSLDLARRNQLPAAIEAIDSISDDAFEHAGAAEASLLVRNVALFCEQAGDLAKACGYYRRFLMTFGNEAAILYALASVLSRMGEAEESVHYRQLARQVSQDTGGSDMLEILPREPQPPSE